MKQLYKNMKLQTKLITTFSLVILVLAAQGIGFIFSLSNVNDKVDTVVHRIQPALKLARYSSSIASNANSDLEFYLESKDESQKKAYQENVLHLNEKILEIRNSELINQLDNSEKNINSLTDDIKFITSLTDQVDKLSTNEGNKLNTTEYASEYLNPIVKEVAQLLNEAVHSENDGDADIETYESILADFNEIRYTWSNTVNELRLFIGFGSPAAKDNILIYIEKIGLLIKRINLQEDALSFEQANAMEEIDGKIKTYTENINTLLNMYDGKQWVVDTQFINTKIKPRIESISTIIDSVKLQLEEKGQAATVSVNNMYKTQSNIIGTSSVIMLLVICALCYLLIRNITIPIAEAVKFANTISEGDLSADIKPDSTDETGQLLTALQAMKTSLKKQVESEYLLLENSNRLKQALNSATVNVMIVELSSKISFISNSLNQYFKLNETSFREVVAAFDVGKIITSEIGIILNDNDLKDTLLNLPENYSKFYTIGSQTLLLKFTPIVDNENEHVGTVIEWYNRTQEVAIENEIQNIVNASLNGDLSQRIDITDKSGFFERLSKGVNEMVNVSEHIIKDTAEVLSHMSHGDLTQSIKGDYKGSFSQLKDDVNGTINKLTIVMSEINTSANSVLNGAHEIFQGNTNLLQRTESQASSLEETASSMEQMTSTVQQNASNAQQANTLALGASDIASKGGEVVNKAVDAMAEITSSSKKIADIISVIDEIAFQTNLLALNAAVEAARAGEQGRGFAVVASEVRNLAGRSATAAKEIKGLIGESVTKVNEGSILVDKSGQTLKEIMQAFKKVTDIISEIATAGKEQAAGIEQVNNAINQMDQITQQNAGLVEEAAVASEAMGEQARNLNQLVGFFALDEGKNNDKTERRSNSRPWKTDTNKDPMTVDNSANIDFSSASLNHLKWKNKLRSFLDGESQDDKKLEIDHHDCALGKWLYSHGMHDYEHINEMKTLEKVHAELHSTGKEVVQLKLKDKNGEAKKKFAKVESISAKIVVLLNNIEGKLISENKNKASMADSGFTKHKTGTDDWEHF